MFTGIIETTGIIREIIPEGSNKNFWIESPITHDLRIDQSLAHSGVCLTVVAIENTQYKVTAVAETLQKTTLDNWQPGDAVNLERSLRVGDRIDGHFVQGHVDGTGRCIAKETLDGSWKYRFQFPDTFAALVIEKGSVCINGVSLTVFEVGRNECTVTIIPYTFEQTTFRHLEAGHAVNMEFDVLGKYLVRRQELSVAQ